MSEDKIYPSMVIRSQAEAIELLEQENKQLKLDYELYKDNHIYKNYEVETKDNTIKQLKEVIEEVWNFIKSYPGISQSGVMTIKAILHKVKGELENE